MSSLPTQLLSGNNKRKHDEMIKDDEESKQNSVQQNIQQLVQQNSHLQSQPSPHQNQHQSVQQHPQSVQQQQQLQSPSSHQSQHQNVQQQPQSLQTPPQLQSQLQQHSPQMSSQASLSPSPRSVIGLEALGFHSTSDGLNDRKKGRGGKREGAGRKKKGTPTQVSTPMLAIRPSPHQGNGNPILTEDPQRVFGVLRSQVQLQGPPYLTRHTDAPGSPEKEDDISIDELVALVVALNQKFVRYARRESQSRQQFFNLKKEKDELHWRLTEALKSKETLEQQLTGTRIEDQFLFTKNEKSGNDGANSGLNQDETYPDVEDSVTSQTLTEQPPVESGVDVNHVLPLGNTEFSANNPRTPEANFVQKEEQMHVHDQ